MKGFFIFYQEQEALGHIRVVFPDSMSSSRWHGATRLVGFCYLPTRYNKHLSDYYPLGKILERRVDREKSKR